MVKQDLVAESVKGAPAVASGVYAVLTLDKMVMIATLVYVAIQCAYLVRKWWREEKEQKRSNRERKA